MLTAVALFVFHRFEPFLLYNKSLNASNLNVSLDFVSGNIEILGKQISLFPSGPVIKCLFIYGKVVEVNPSVVINSFLVGILPY